MTISPSLSSIERPTASTSSSLSINSVAVTSVEEHGSTLSSLRPQQSQLFSDRLKQLFLSGCHLIRRLFCGIFDPIVRIFRWIVYREHPVDFSRDPIERDIDGLEAMHIENLTSSRTGAACQEFEDPAQIDPATILPSGGVVDTYPDMAIARAEISRAPSNNASIDSMRELASNEGRSVESLGELVRFVDRLFADESKDARSRMKNKLRDYVQYARARPNELSLNYRHRSLRLLIRGIIVQLRKPDAEVPLVKKKTALLQLKSAQSRCFARRYEEALRQYNLLTLPPNMEDRLWLYIRQIKEDLFVERFQRGQFHVVNYVRAKVGHVLGLDTSPLNTRGDEYLSCGYCGSGEELIGAFNQFFTVRTLIEGIKERLRFDGYDAAEVAHILEEHITTLGRHHAQFIDSSTNQPITCDTFCFDIGGINERGVILLLHKIGILEVDFNRLNLPYFVIRPLA